MSGARAKGVSMPLVTASRERVLKMRSLKASVLMPDAGATC
jgi:hypothetical protein